MRKYRALVALTVLVENGQKHYLDRQITDESISIQQCINDLWDQMKENLSGLKYRNQEIRVEEHPVDSAPTVSHTFIRYTENENETFVRKSCTYLDQPALTKTLP